MKRCKSSQAVNAPKVTVKQRTHFTRFSHNQGPVVAKLDRNEQDVHTVKLDRSKQFFYEQEQKAAEEIEKIVALKEANLRTFLGYCAAFLYIGFLAFSLFEFHMTGNTWLLISDIPVSVGFWKIIDHILLQKRQV